MASVVRLILFLCLIISFVIPRAYAETQPVSLSTLVTVQNVPFEDCTKVFNIDAESLFYLTIASINANRFKISEIQSKTGYILFSAVNKDFLASVVKLDSKNSLLRVTPTNNVYYFQPGIVLNMFRYIELNSTVRPVQIKTNL